MINEDRVREEFFLAKTENEHGQDLAREASYFKSDYVGRELLKSFLSGTVAYVLILVLYGMIRMDYLLENINSLDYLGIGMMVLLYYLAFMIAYMFITLVVYSVRYKKNHKIAVNYTNHLKKLEKIYSREDKLKA